MLAGAANEKTALKMIPWSVLILIAGVNVLMNITQKLGGIDLLASILATFMSSRTAAPIMGVTVFGLDQENGRMTYLQNIKTKGEQPRFITIKPDGTKLLAANKLTDTICCMDIDPETGLLSYSKTEIEAESPVCVVFKTK